MKGKVVSLPPPSMLMLPVADLQAAASFYKASFGWDANSIGPRALALTSGGAITVVLIAADYLAAEAGAGAASAGSAATAVISVASRDQVDAAQEDAWQAGAAVTSPARERDFGIYSFYLTDPDGNGWEILTNPSPPS